MQQRMQGCCENLALIVEDPPILSKIITVIESWIHYFDSNTKCESETWKHPEEPRPKKVGQEKSAGKVLLVAFFDCRGLVHQYYCPPKTRSNAEYYIKTLEKLREHIRRKRPDLRNQFIFHQDNVRPHSASIVPQWSEEHNIQMFNHLPYSLDLAPCNFWLFPTLKKHFGEHQFRTDQDVVTATTTFFNRLEEAKFHKTIEQKWSERMENCIRNDGWYFEKECRQNCNSHGHL